MSSVPFEPTFRKNPFEQFSRFFLDDPSLPFAKVLPAELSLNALEELAVQVRCPCPGPLAEPGEIGTGTENESDNESAETESIEADSSK